MARTRAAETPDLAEERDADSVDAPLPRRRSSAETAKLGSEAQMAIRLERIETSIDTLRGSVEECRRDMRAVVKALEGRTRVSEQCLALVRRMVDGLLAPTRGTITLAALAVVAITVVVAPSVLVQTAPDVTAAVVQWMRGERISGSPDDPPPRAVEPAEPAGP